MAETTNNYTQIHTKEFVVRKKIKKNRKISMLWNTLSNLLEADRDFFGQDHQCVYCEADQPDHTAECVISKAREALLLCAPSKPRK